MILSSMLFACVTEIGNPEGTIDVAALARTSAPESVGITAGGDLTITRARVTLREIRLEPADRCDNDAGEIDIEGPWTVDLASGDLMELVPIEGRTFCRLRLRIDRDEADDLSLVVEGTRADDVPFVLESRANPTLELRARDGQPAFTLDDALDGVALAFDLARWLPFDADSLDVGKDGVIRVDHDNNRDTLDLVEDGLEDALDLYSDADGDGALDEGVDDVLATVQ